MIGFFNTIVNACADVFKLTAVQNTLFMLLVLLLLRIIKNIPARFKYIIAAIGLCKAVLPVFIPAPFLHQPVYTVMSFEASPVAFTPVNVVMPAPTLSVGGWIVLIWSLVFVGILLYSLFLSLYWRFKLRQAAYLMDFSWIGRSVPVYTSSKISVPFTVGVLNPKIYVPGQWGTWPQTSRQFILKHEMAHIARGDNFFRFLQQLICAALFFHPLVWMLAKKLDEYREMACDDFATNGIQANSIEYARALVTIAEDLLPAMCPSASASALIKQKHELYNRINYQMENAMKSKNTKRSVWLVAMLFLLIVPLSWTKPAPKEAAPPPPAKSVGKIIGKLTDVESGEPLPGANVFVLNTDLVAVTNKEGKYYIAKVPQGEYQLEFRFLGYSLEHREVQVLPHQSTLLNVSLHVGPPPPAHAKSVGKIFGKLSDEASGEPLPGANVFVLNTELGAATDKEGKYYIANVPQGEYQLEFRFLGFYSERRKAQVRPRQATEVNANLQIAPVEPQKVPNKDGVYIAFDQSPEAIGGYGAIPQNLVYPEIARKAGIEGKVIIFTTIDENGGVVGTEVVKSLGENNGCDEAAVTAIKKTQWKPALVDGKPVKAQVSIPVVFKLAKNDESAQIEADEAPIFLAYDKAPEAIGGYGAIQQNLVYPEIARKAGVEGKVIILAVIDENGDVIKTGVVKSLGNNGCDEAAIAAVKKAQWKPGLLEGKPVKVQISIPVVFKLANDNNAGPKSIDFAFSEKTIKWLKKHPQLDGEKIMVSVTINEDGKVTNAEIVDSVDKKLAKMILSDLKKSTWQPATENGNPVVKEVKFPLVLKQK